MAVLGSTFINQIDILKQRGPDGVATAAQINLMSKLSPVYKYGRSGPCNEGTSHLHNILMKLPSVAWGRLYKGTPASKAGFAQVRDTTGWIEGLVQVDERQLELYPGEENTVMMNEAEGFVEAIAQEFETAFFYSDITTTPDQFKGLAARYNTIATSGAGRQIIDAGGTGSDNTSVWFVTWSDKHTSLIHPQGMESNIKVKDRGSEKVEDGDGNYYWARMEQWTLHCGLSVGDYRYNVRVANIDVSDLIAGSVDIYKWMRKAYYRLKSRTIPGGQQVIYMNADVLEAMDAANTNFPAGSDNYVRLKPMELEGQEVQSYRRIPILETEHLLNTEARVV
jgi:hypothetical protein